MNLVKSNINTVVGDQFTFFKLICGSFYLFLSLHLASIIYFLHPPNLLISFIISSCLVHINTCIRGRLENEEVNFSPFI